MAFLTNPIFLERKDRLLSTVIELFAGYRFEDISIRMIREKLWVNFEMAICSFSLKEGLFSTIFNSRYLNPLLVEVFHEEV